VSLIRWSEPCTTVAADPGATLALDRVAWETLGARFAAADDGQGETPGLACALLRTAAGDVEIGILDYGEPATYILVPGRGARHAEMTDAVLNALAEAGAISLDADVIDVISPASGSPSPDEPTIEDVRKLGGDSRRTPASALDAQPHAS